MLLIPHFEWVVGIAGLTLWRDNELIPCMNRGIDYKASPTLLSTCTIHSVFCALCLFSKLLTESENVAEAKTKPKAKEKQANKQKKTTAPQRSNCSGFRKMAQ